MILQTEEVKMERELFHSVLTEPKSNHLKLPLSALIGFILAATTLFGKISPFAAAFLSSLNGGCCFAAFAGSALGFLACGNFMNAIPSLASMVAIGALRFFLGKSYSRLIHLGTSALTAASVFLTNAVMAKQPTDIFIALGFGLVSGVSSYSLIQLYRIVGQERSIILLKPGNMAAVGAVFAFGIAALTSFQFGIFNVGIVTAVVFILAFGSRYRFSGAAVCGIIAAFGIALSDVDLASSGLILCTGGIVGALFTRFGKLTQAAGFILASAVSVSILGANVHTLGTMVGSLTGCVLFMALPVQNLVRRFQQKPAAKMGAEAAEIFGQRLVSMGDALGEMKTAVEKTAEVLDKQNVRDISWVYTAACDKICVRCHSNMKCWGEDYNDTVRQMSKLMEKLRKGQRIDKDDFTGTIGNICSRTSRFAAAINDKYHEFTAMNQSGRKISEMRNILTAQLDATEKLLRCTAGEFDGETVYDRRSGAKVEDILTVCGLDEPKAMVMITEGSMRIEAYGRGRLEVTAEELCDSVINGLQREFDLPDIVYQGNGRVRITMFESALYTVEAECFQLSLTGEKSCGDYFESFSDGKGYSYYILSDGMGSGARARIDSAFACGMLLKLLRAGVDMEAAVEILNTSLLVKSTDESFATLDICRVDLYSGRVDLFKAGAAATYIKCGRRIVKAGGRGMPVGIDYLPKMERQSFTIGENDMVIMTSDGAELSESWLEHELEKESSRDMKALAGKIAETARLNNGKDREDDISVAVIKLCK